MQRQRKTTKATTSELISEALCEQIINGTLVSQEKLVESEIAQQFGTSRGPVRDALRQLAMEGLVDYRPNKGCSVALLSPEDAYEVFFLRGSLEKLAIQKSNCHISDYGLLIMETTIEELRIAEEADNLMQAIRADEKFHQQIIQSAQIHRLTKMWELLSPLNGAMFLSVRNANQFGKQIGDDETITRSGGTAASHRRVLAAIRKNDVAAACRELDFHYEKTGERVYRLSLLQEKAPFYRPKFS